MKTTIEIGKEHDKKTFAALRRVLSDAGANLVDKNWGVAGSQEVSTWKVKIMDEEIEIVAETYIGLTITGSAELVSQIASAVTEATAD